MSKLFSPLKLRELEIRNRIFVSPMCQYSANDGLANTWHLVHLGSRAVGGAGLVMVEATAVSPHGRISPNDLGLWSDAHIEPLREITKFIRTQNSVPAIQLAHAGRKGSVTPPWMGAKPVPPAEGGWQPEAPSAVPFAAHSDVPHAVTEDEIEKLVLDFCTATRRAEAAGFDVVEIHMAHGYLLHEFLSPLSNRREDDYGGNLENRARLPRRIARAVREIWPASLPVFVRLSVTDWVEGGWTLEESVHLARWLKEDGIDLIDCSSGGLMPDVRIPLGPGYQTPFAAAIREHVGITTGAVGLITDAIQAEHIIATGQADVVLLARELLRDPYWPLHAARELGVDVPWPLQYERAKPR
ncbi:MAG: NADH:flavin oxidoreductase/NADH oxidase [Gammaproteobacteria bacterium]|nr:NADH:flavin oxidoreductase/NADH oxidase [Gammaproteobacteria bacterium]